MTSIRPPFSPASVALLLDHAPDLVAIFDREQRYLYVNAAIVAATGIDAGRFVGRTSEELGLPPMLCARWRAALDAALAQTGFCEYEFEFEGPEGTRWYEARSVTENGEFGQVESVLCVMRDVTARKQQHQALVRSEARLRALTTAIPAVIWSADADGRCDYMSERWTRFVDMPSSTALGDGWLGVVFDEDREWARRRWARAVATGEPIDAEARVRLASGAVRWHLIRARPVLGPDGRITGWFGTATDVHDARLAHDALRESEARLGATLESAMDAIVAVDINGRIVLFNAAAERSFGVLRHVAVGQPLSDFLPSAPHASDVALDGVDGARPIELVARRGDGCEFPAEVTVAATVTGGQTLGTYIIRDCTERNAMADELRKAQRLEAVGRLAGGVAHDFNNLLTVVQGNADLLLASLPPDGVERVEVEEIRECAGIATQLTRQLLAISRRQVPQPKIVEPNAVIETIARLLRRVLGTRTELRTDLTPGIGAVRVDPGQLEQVLLNLTLNARDAMPHGGTLVIRTRQFEPRLVPTPSRASGEIASMPGILIEVKDSGEGIAPETLGRVFEPFFTTKADGTGTGLGLSIVAGIVRQAGGDVWLDSVRGLGTAVWVYLPVTEATAAPTDVLQLTPTAGGTVLVVDDEDIVRSLVRRILAADGYRVVEARDGREALARWREHGGPEGRIVAVVSDVAMPVMRGTALVRALRESRADVPVLLISGHTDGAAELERMCDARTAFLPKPFAPDALRGALATLRQAVAKALR